MKRPTTSHTTNASSNNAAALASAELSHVRGGATIRFFTGCIGCDCNCDTCKKKANKLASGS